MQQRMKWRIGLAEFIGTFALCFVGILAVRHLANQPGGLLGIALAHGLVVSTFATAVMTLSGGHFNPAVSIAMLLIGRLNPLETVWYIAWQIGGAVVGTYASVLAVSGDPTPMLRAATHGIQPGYSLLNGIVGEIIATFFLLFIIFGTAVDRRAPKLGAHLVGLAVALLILAVGPISGASLNPARWFGPALIGGNLSEWLIGALSPIIGAGAAAAVYRFFWPVDEVPSAP